MKLTKNTLIEGKIVPKGTKIIIEDTKFDYMMLNRLQTDAEYYRDTGSAYSLYYRDDPKAHYQAMEDLFNSLPDEPEWLTKKDLEGYKKLLLNESTTNKEVDTKSIEEAFNSNVDVENLVYEVQDLTSRNNHTEARLLIAEEFGMTKYYDLFMKIKEIQDIEGYLPNNVMLYRSQITNDMLEIIEKLSGKDVRDAVYSAM